MTLIFALLNENFHVFSVKITLVFTEKKCYLAKVVNSLKHFKNHFAIERNLTTTDFSNKNTIKLRTLQDFRNIIRLINFFTYFHNNFKHSENESILYINNLKIIVKACLK